MGHCPTSKPGWVAWSRLRPVVQNHPFRFAVGAVARALGPAGACGAGEISDLDGTRVTAPSRLSGRPGGQAGQRGSADDTRLEQYRYHRADGDPEDNQGQHHQRTTDQYGGDRNSSTWRARWGSATEATARRKTGNLDRKAAVEHGTNIVHSGRNEKRPRIWEANGQPVSGENEPQACVGVAAAQGTAPAVSHSGSSSPLNGSYLRPARLIVIRAAQVDVFVPIGARLDFGEGSADRPDPIFDEKSADDRRDGGGLAALLLFIDARSGRPQRRFADHHRLET